MAGAQVGCGGQPSGFGIDQRPEVADFAGRRRHGGSKAGHHLAVFHPAHEVAEIGAGLAGQGIVPGDVDELHLRMHGRGLADAVLHVIGVADDQFGTLADQIVNQHRDGDAGTVGRVDLVDVEHLCAGQNLFHGLASLEVGLTPAVVIGRPHHQQAEGVVGGYGAERIAGDAQQYAKKNQHMRECGEIFHVFTPCFLG
ncbi:MAG: hypothetical protein ACD_75C01798G0001, partial [uncultured bacterium]